MSFPSPSLVAPYLALVSAASALGAVGLILNLAREFRENSAVRLQGVQENFRLMKEAQEERARVLEQRLLSIQEDLQRTERAGKLKEEQLNRENTELKERLEKLLLDSGLSDDSPITNRTLANLKDGIRESIKELVDEMQLAEKSGEGIEDPGWNLQLAKGFMATQEWSKAAIHFDRYVSTNPSDWEAQWLRAVAYANSGTDNLTALRAYNETIALAPAVVDGDRRARMFDSRGAMLKRLGRLSEAEYDLKLAQQFSAGNDLDLVRDIRYNLACVFAMKGDREMLISILRELRGCHTQINQIRSHLDDYFAAFKTDADFLQELAQPAHKGIFRSV